jgi:hypothetical protein
MKQPPIRVADWMMMRVNVQRKLVAIFENPITRAPKNGTSPGVAFYQIDEERRTARRFTKRKQDVTQTIVILATDLIYDAMSLNVHCEQNVHLYWRMYSPNS